ncbi:MAG: tetratricopeptide repeat protein [Planctomycetota bacterium]
MNPRANANLRRLTTATLLGAALLTAGALTGCSGKTQHEKNKVAAENRWQDLRSHVMLETAHNQFMAGQIKQAEKTVRDAARVDPDNPRLFTLAGRVALEKGELEDAFKLFARAIMLQTPPTDAELTPEQRAKFLVKDPDPYYFQGVVLQRWQKHDDALERYEAAHRIEPDNASRLLAVAEAKVTLGRYDEAIEDLERRLNYFDSNAAIRVTLGHVYGLKNQPEKAVEYYRHAAVLAPDDPILREELARTLIEAGDPEAAADVLAELLRQHDQQNRTDLMRRLASAQLDAGRVADARQTYIDITNLERDRTGDWIKLGELSWRLDDLGGALIAANKVMELSPNRHEGYLMAGMVWQKRGRLADALRLYDHAAKLVPGDTTPLLMRGLALQKAGKPAAAARAYEQALERDPRDRRAQRLLSALRPADEAQAGVDVN